jgi:putative transposase
MHLTLKKEATKPAAANFLQQQARFDKFMDVYKCVSYCPTSLCG